MYLRKKSTLKRVAIKGVVHCQHWAARRTNINIREEEMCESTKCTKTYEKKLVNISSTCCYQQGLTRGVMGPG